MIVTDQLAEMDALVAAWLPGSQGEGVAEVLFGHRSFTGRLSMTWPRTLEQEPINVGDRDYHPLFPTGTGCIPNTAERWPTPGAGSLLDGQGDVPRPGAAAMTTSEDTGARTITKHELAQCSRPPTSAGAASPAGTCPAWSTRASPPRPGWPVSGP
jgi:hypothetical protein